MGQNKFFGVPLSSHDEVTSKELKVRELSKKPNSILEVYRDVSKRGGPIKPITSTPRNSFAIEAAYGKRYPLSGDKWGPNKTNRDLPPDNPLLANNVIDAIFGPGSVESAFSLENIGPGASTAGAPFSAYKKAKGIEKIYHGTPREFEYFDPSKYDTDDVLGWMTHFAEHPSYADSYATGSSKHGSFYGGKPRLIPAQPDAKNVLDLVDPNADDISQAVAFSENKPQLIEWFKKTRRRRRENISPDWDDFKHGAHRNAPENEHAIRSVAENIRLSPQTTENMPWDAIRYHDVNERSWAIPAKTPMFSQSGAPLTKESHTIPISPIKMLRQDEVSTGNFPILGGYKYGTRERLARDLKSAGISHDQNVSNMTNQQINDYLKIKKDNAKVDPYAESNKNWIADMIDTTPTKEKALKKAKEMLDYGNISQEEYTIAHNKIYDKFGGKPEDIMGKKYKVTSPAGNSFNVTIKSQTDLNEYKKFKGDGYTFEEIKPTQSLEIKPGFKMQDNSMFQDAALPDGDDYYVLFDPTKKKGFYSIAGNEQVAKDYAKQHGMEYLNAKEYKARAKKAGSIYDEPNFEAENEPYDWYGEAVGNLNVHKSKHAAMIDANSLINNNYISDDEYSKLVNIIDKKFDKPSDIANYSITDHEGQTMTIQDLIDKKMVGTGTTPEEALKLVESVGFKVDKLKKSLDKLDSLTKGKK